MQKKVIIILGSSRSHGDTRKLIDRVREEIDADFIDLNDLQISYYDYEYKNQEDDFLPTMKRVVEYDKIILASPVYWYSMSGVMKTFVDRFSDLIRIHKQVGRQLRGKQLYTISSSSDSTVYACFLEAFELTAKYLGMDYDGYLYGWIENEEIPKSLIPALKSFIDKLK